VVGNKGEFPVCNCNFRWWSTGRKAILRGKCCWFKYKQQTWLYDDCIKMKGLIPTYREGSGRLAYTFEPWRYCRRRRSWQKAVWAWTRNVLWQDEVTFNPVGDQVVITACIGVKRIRSFQHTRLFNGKYLILYVTVEQNEFCSHVIFTPRYETK
jgi:hypothetical protein